MINVLVVEDSRVVCEYLVYILESDPAIRVIGTAACGEDALACVSRRRPDVIVMDLHLPGIDGFEATRRIMSTMPVPIVICTASVSFSDVQTALRGLEAGALAVVKKPKGLGDPPAEANAAEMLQTIKLMSEVKVVRRWRRTPAPGPAQSPASPARVEETGREIAVVAIGASTGGPPAIQRILSGLAPSFPAPILLVQHISVGFTSGLADWLSSACRLPVRVARGGEIPLPGHVYLAPDELHLRVGLLGELETSRDEPLHGVRPAIGVLFRSVAERYGRRAIGILLTGMGRDGADELKLMADQGALTVAQDEESCVVFGMPAEAIRAGAANVVLPLQEIAGLLTSVSRRAGS